MTKQLNPFRCWDRIPPTKLENHQGQEITPDELVADRYFKDNNDIAKPPEDGGTTAAITKTSIEAAKHSSQENNNIERGD
jgi:hypothetical protein